MKLIISYVSTDLAKLNNFWIRNGSNGERLGSMVPKPRDLGGAIEIIDYPSKKKIAESFFDSPMAVFYDSEIDLILYSNALNELVLLNNDLSLLQVVKSPLFNSIHSIFKRGKRYIFSSSGIDALIEYDFATRLAELIWTPRGSKYSLFPDGSEREIDYDDDHSKVTYPTLQQLTHVNSCEVYGDGNMILCTLFHQGVLLSVDLLKRENNVIIQGLRAPHGAHVYKVSDVYYGMCSDSRHNRVLLDIPLMGTGRHRKIEDGFDWVQNAKISIRDNLIFVLDANNGRVVIYDYVSLKKIDEYVYEKDRRVFDLCII